jgi:hypothetical protein
VSETYGGRDIVPYAASATVKESVEKAGSLVCLHALLA